MVTRYNIYLSAHPVERTETSKADLDAVKDTHGQIWIDILEILDVQPFENFKPISIELNISALVQINLIPEKCVTICKIKSRPTMQGCSSVPLSSLSLTLSITRSTFVEVVPLKISTCLPPTYLYLTKY